MSEKGGVSDNDQIKDKKKELEEMYKRLAYLDEEE